MKAIWLFQHLQFSKHFSLGLFEQCRRHFLQLPSYSSGPKRRPILFLIGVDEFIFFDGDADVLETGLL